MAIFGKTMMLESYLRFKPMLASAIEDTSILKFPVFVSIKLDGIRATIQGGQLLSRSLKPIPNKNVQRLFASLPDGLDGELIYGDPAHPDCYRTTTSIVMSEDKDSEGIRFHLFDRFPLNDVTQDIDRPFINRYNEVVAGVNVVRDSRVVLVQHKLVNNQEELLEFEAKALENGHEGVMVRSLDGPYKQGRSSVKEGYLLKLKRFQDAEAEVIGFYEEMENTNEAKTNALGHTERSTAKAGKIAKGTLGGFSVRDIKTGVEFEVGGGYTAEMREVYWKKRHSLVGKILKYKYFPSGSKERPRFPVFLGFRDKRDIGENV